MSATSSATTACASPNGSSRTGPSGGKVAVIEGQAGVFAAGQRTKGFTDTITQGGKFTVVASVPGNWDRQVAYDAAATILQQNPGPRRLLRQQ